MPLNTIPAVSVAGDEAAKVATKRGMPVPEVSRGASDNAEAAASSAAASPSRSASRSAASSRRRGASASPNDRRKPRLLVWPRSPRAGMRGSRSPHRRGSVPGGRPRQFNRPCWFGRDCSRRDCCFLHLDGRKIDEGASPKRVRRERAARGHLPPRRNRSPAIAGSPSRGGAKLRSRSTSRSAAPARRRQRRGGGGGRAPTTPSKASSSPSPAAAEEEGAVSGGEESDGAVQDAQEGPAESFRSFVLQELDDDATPAEALQRWKDRQEELARRSYEELRQTGLLFDLYHPLALVRSFDFRVRSAQRNAEAFLQDVKEQRYCGLFLRTPASTQPGPSCPVAGHLHSPYYAFDPDVNSIVIRGVPVAVSVWDVYDLLQQCAGFVTMAAPRPAPGGALSRDVRGRFASAEQARAAAAAVAGQVVAGHTLKPALVDPTPSLSALVAPPEMSHPERIAKDLALAEPIIRLLDQQLGIPQSITEALLAEQGTTEAKLDLQLLYLRRVHNFCFYAAAWCDDEWDLRDRCGPALLRDGLHGGASAPQEGEWSRMHEQRLAEFREGASLKRPSVVMGDDKRLRSKAMEVYEQKTVQIAEAKFQCRACGKFFRGPEFVQKHLRKVHTDLFEALRQEAHEEAARRGFLADPERPRAPAPKVVS